MPPLCLIRCVFEVLKPITHLPHYQGSLWSALLRHGLNPLLEEVGHDFHELGVFLTPADSGISEYAPGELLELGLSFPAIAQGPMASFLAHLEEHSSMHGQLAPGNTIRLKSCQCRVSDVAWPQNPATPLIPQVLHPAVEALRRLQRFRLIFISPLRLKMGTHREGRRHQFCDEHFFQNNPRAFQHLLEQVCLEYYGDASPGMVDAPVITATHAMWYDMNYGRTTKDTTIGGMLGGVMAE
ncbi:MAG: hypothetical protein HQM12_20325, partial [SAR324 cluster bacterium]|nr:hypothetical protein [SAR324 cluster bacterium]